MATDLVALRAFRDALLKARFHGRRSIRFDDQEVTYRSDSELAAAIADCERRIAGLEGRKVKAVRFNTSKGL